MNVRRGDLVLTDLDPTKGGEIRKTRPAVVIQNDAGNDHSTTTIVAPVTSTYRGYPFEVELESEDEDVEQDLSNSIEAVDGPRPACSTASFDEEADVTVSRFRQVRHQGKVI